MKTTNISFDRQRYYKNYYQKNKEYLRHRQRLRYYRNTTKFYQLLREYNKILLTKNANDKYYRDYCPKDKLNRYDTNKLYIVTFF